MNERTVYKSKHVRRLSMPNNGETERLLKTARSSRNKDNDSLKRPHSQQGFSDTPIVEYKDSSKLKQLFKEIDTKSQTLEEYPHETLIKN